MIYLSPAVQIPASAHTQPEPDQCDDRVGEIQTKPVATANYYSTSRSQAISSDMCMYYVVATQEAE